MSTRTSSKEVQIRQLLLLEHRAKHKPAQAIKNVKAKIGQCELTMETVNFWFKRFDKGDTSLYKNQLNAYEMPQIVSDDNYLASDFYKFRSVNDPLMNGKLVSNDGRLAFIFGFKKFRNTKLFVVDSLNGDSKEVYAAGCLAGIKEDSRNNYPIVIDNEHLLIYNDSKLMISLLKFDADSWKFKLSSQVHVGNAFKPRFGPNLTLDELDKRKFLFSNCYGNCVAGTVEGGTIRINRSFFEPNLGSTQLARYIGNKLVRLRIGWQNRLVEYELGGLVEPLFYGFPLNFDTGARLSFELTSAIDILWHKDWAYVAAEYPVKLTKVYAFNLETKTWSDTKIIVMGRSTGMFIDENDVFTLKICEDEASGTNNFYRFPLKKPESLMNLAWLSVLRRSTVFGNELFDQFGESLPYTCELRSLLPEEEEE